MATLNSLSWYYACGIRNNFFFYKECQPGHYGLDCMDNCIGHCLNNQPCDHISGVCSSGCQDGYTGPLCTDGKKHFFFFCNILVTIKGLS